MNSKFLLLLGALATLLLLNYRRLALPSPQPNLLRFAHTFTTASERAILDDAIAEFIADHPDTRIEQNVSNSETYNTVGWRLQFRSRIPPDIYFHWEGFKTDEAIRRGWAMDLKPYLSPGFVNEFVPNAVRPRQDAIYFLPQSFDLSNLVWYNRSLFEQLNLQAPSSLADWFIVCQRLREAGHLALAQGNRDLWPMGNFAAELLGQTIGPTGYARLFAPGITIAESDTAGLRTLSRMLTAGWFDKPGLLEARSINMLHDIDAKVLFFNGLSAQHIVGSWFLGDVRDAEQRRELKFPLDFFPVPSADGEAPATVAVATGYLVHPRTKNPRAAVAFLELLLSRKYQARFAELGHLSGRRDAREFIAHPLTRRLWDVLAGGSALLAPPDTGFKPEQAAAFYRVCARVLAGDIDGTGATQLWNTEKRYLSRKGS